jgi:DNA-binding NarL/FixJ family response regulator
VTPEGRSVASSDGDPLVAVRITGDDFATAVAEQASADGFTVVEDAPDPQDALRVLCWRQVTQEAIAETAALREQGWRRLVAVVDDVPTAHLIRALTLRLDGVVALDDLARALRPTFLAVLAGQTAHPLAFRDHLERPLLSAREKQVLAMVVLGLTNAEIAQKLFVTEAAVKAHLTSAFAKLGVRSREAAAALILDPDAGYGPGILRITSDS